jgi:immune inhibitor A
MSIYDQPQQPKSKSSIATIVIILLIAGCLLMVCLVAGGLLAFQAIRETGTIIQATVVGEFIPTLVRQSSTPAPVATTPLPPGTTAVPRAPVSAGPLESALTLKNALVPIRDPRDVAARLKGIKDVPETIQTAPKIYKIGDQEQFWVVDNDTDKPFQMTATLAYSTAHLYLWADKSMEWKPENARLLAENFENKIYPTDREFFGSEWTPGIDNDPHLFVLFANGIGSRVAGYFSSSDEVNPLIDPRSNGHEMFVMNAASFPGMVDDYTDTVLAHEFQHMIHWYRDRNEESWMNEGFSELAAFLNGYGVGGHDRAFSSQPDLQLNDWPNDKNATLPHYGASYLFLNYFLNRFGEKTTQTLVGMPENGLDSIDKLLADTQAKDAVTGKPVTANDFYVDWTLSNYLLDKNVGDGRFIYQNYKSAPKVVDTEKITKCPTSNLNRTVSQYGTDYMRITCRGKYTLQFYGSQDVNVVPAAPHSGVYSFWSNKGDESDITLTRSFDFSAVSGSIDLSYWTWYDLEENYDYVYLVASTDGQNWEMLPTSTGTRENVAGSNLGIGYNNVSKGWIQEKVDLSKYAGKKVTLRFEYLTDAAVNGEGFLLDDVAIPQISYSTDFEKDDGGWEAKGFVRIQEHIPQTFRVSLIWPGSPAKVEYLEVSPLQTLQVPLTLDSDVVVVVSGTTRYTRQKAAYSFQVAP